MPGDGDSAILVDSRRIPRSGRNTLTMPKQKSHRGLLKRIKLTKSGKVRFKAPNSRHIKSNKTGTQVQSYRKSRYARTGDLRYLKKLLNRGLRSEEQHVADEKAREASKAAAK